MYVHVLMLSSMDGIRSAHFTVVTQYIPSSLMMVTVATFGSTVIAPGGSLETRLTQKTSLGSGVASLVMPN